MWRPISLAPFDCDLHLAVLDEHGEHSLVFPAQRVVGGWVHSETRQRLDLRPTHWKPWQPEN